MSPNYGGHWTKKKKNCIVKNKVTHSEGAFKGLIYSCSGNAVI